MALRNDLTGDFSQEIFELQPLEWCTGIFRRRFDRPSNSLIRHLQITEETSLSQPFPAVHRNSGSRSKFEDEPLPPPPEIQSKLPDFIVCAPNKCGDHVRPGEHPEVPVDCYKCKVTSAIKTMHPLPCGHYICYKDLEKLAVKAFTRIQDVAIGDSLLITRLELSQMQEQMEEIEDDSTLQYQQRRIDNHMTFLQAQVGLTCACGKDMKLLDTHMQCLDPKAARGLWTVNMFLSADPNFSPLRCGWPDCEKYLPPQYTWLDQGIDDAYAQRWHCVVCGGNSKLQSNGQFQPAR